MLPHTFCCFRRPLALAAAGAALCVAAVATAAPVPAVHELAMRRLRDEFGVEPVEYPTTRRLNASPQDRAADLTAAFADPTVRAVLASIGGDDQLTILPFLDPTVIAANPKPFCGYSDNTNLLNWLWNLGIVSYHGGSTMVHLGRGGGTHPISASSLRAALFTGGEVELHPVDVFSEDELDWNEPTLLDQPAPTIATPGWSWHQPDRVVSAPTWGGNLEILHWNLAANRWIRPVDDYAGERGLLAQFPAAIMGTAKASSLARRTSLEERRRYRAEQREAILHAFDRYNPDAMIVFNVDFGHTDPQWILPYGGTVTVDGPARRITGHY